MKKNAEKEKDNLSFLVKGRDLKELVPPSITNQPRQQFKLTGLSNSLNTENDKYGGIPQIEPDQNSMIKFLDWSKEDELCLETKGEMFIDPEKAKIILPQSITETDYSQSFPKCSLIKWMRPEEYIRESLLDKELFAKNIPQKMQAVIKKKVHMVLNYQKEKDNRHYSKNSDTNTGQSIKTIIKTPITPSVGRKTILSKLAPSKSKVIKNTNNESKVPQKDNSNSEYLKQIEIEENMIKFDNYLKIFARKFLLKISSFSMRQETEEEYNKRIHYEEALDRERQENEAKKNKLLKKKVKIAPPEIDYNYKQIKVCEPSALSCVEKLCTFCRWVTSILQSILDLKILDCNLNKEIIRKIYPQVDQEPIVSQEGKYWVQLYYHGRLVKVVIDDTMPVNSNFEFIFPRCESLEELWPSLLTKAIVKLYSSYYSTKSYSIEAIGDASLVYSLTGYIGERCLIDPKLNIVFNNQEIEKFHNQKTNIKSLSIEEPDSPVIIKRLSKLNSYDVRMKKSKPVKYKMAYSYSLHELIKNNSQDLVFNNKRKLLMFYRNNPTDYEEDKPKKIKADGFLGNILQKVDEEETSGPSKKLDLRKPSISGESPTKLKTNMLNIFNNNNRPSLTKNSNSNNNLNIEFHPQKPNDYSSNTPKELLNILENKNSGKKEKKITDFKSGHAKRVTSLALFSVEKKAEILGVGKADMASSNNLFSIAERKETDPLDENKRHNKSQSSSPNKSSKRGLHLKPLSIEKENSLIAKNKDFYNPDKKLLTIGTRKMSTLNTLNYKRIFKGLIDPKASNDKLIDVKETEMAAKPTNPKFGSYYLNFCYPAIDYLDSDGFNMGRLDPIDFKDLIEELVKAKNSKNYKTLSLDEKKKFMEEVETLKVALKKRKKERLAEMNLPSKRVFFYKLKNDCIGAAFPHLFYITEDKIEMAKKCLYNNWKFPPLWYISNLAEERDRKNEYFKLAAKRGSNLNATGDLLGDEKEAKAKSKEKKSKSKKKNKDASKMDKTMNGKHKNTIMSGGNDNNNASEENRDELPIWKKYYYEFVGKNLSFYENEKKQIQRPTGRWISSEDFLGIFNEVIVLHNPTFYQCSHTIKITSSKYNSQFNEQSSNIYLLFSPKPDVPNDWQLSSNNKYNSSKSCILATFEPFLSGSDPSLHFLVVDIRDSSGNYVYKDFVFKRLFSVYQFDEIDPFKKYILIVKGGVYPYGCTLKFYSDHEIKEIPESEFMVSVMCYNSQDVRLKHQPIIANENCVFARFKISYSTELVITGASPMILGPVRSPDRSFGFHQYLNSELRDDKIQELMSDEDEDRESEYESDTKPMKISLFKGVTKRLDNHIARFSDYTSNPLTQNMYFFIKYSNEKTKTIQSYLKYYLNQESLTQMKIPFKSLAASDNQAPLGPIAINKQLPINSPKEVNTNGKVTKVSYLTLTALAPFSLDIEEMSILFAWNPNSGVTIKDLKIEVVEYIEAYEVKEICSANNKQGILFREFAFVRDIVIASLNIEVIDEKGEGNASNYLPTLNSISLGPNNVSFNQIQTVGNISISGLNNNNTNGSFRLNDNLTAKPEKFNDSVQFKMTIEKEGNIIFEKQFYKRLFVPWLILQGSFANDISSTTTAKKQLKDFANPPYHFTLSTNYKEFQVYCLSHNVVETKFSIKSFASNSIAFVQDNTKELLEQQLIEGWEQTNPGRSLLAGTSRIKHIVKEKKHNNLTLSKEEETFLYQTKEEIIAATSTKAKDNKTKKPDFGKSPLKTKSHANVAQHGIASVQSQLSIVPGLTEMVREFNFSKPIKTDTEYFNKSYKEFYRHGMSSKINEFHFEVNTDTRFRGTLFDINSENQKLKNEMILKHIESNTKIISDTSIQKYNQTFTSDFSKTAFNLSQYSSYKKSELSETKKNFNTTRGFSTFHYSKTEAESREVVKKASLEYYENNQALSIIKLNLPQTADDISRYVDTYLNAAQKDKEKMSADLNANLVILRRFNHKEKNYNKKIYNDALNMLTGLKREIYIKELSLANNTLLLKGCHAKIKEEIDSFGLEMGTNFYNFTKTLKPLEDPKLGAK